MKFIELAAFHFNLYLKNHYFLWLMISSTLAMLLLQYVVVDYQHGSLTSTIWLRAGVFGLWTSATTSAGVLRFQRTQGTLPYILNTATDDRLSLVALIIPASSFGICSFLVAALGAVVLGIDLHINILSTIVGVLALWVGSVTLTLFIALFFVLTAHALVYEELLVIPLLLLSGFFALPVELTWLLELGSWLLPIATPMQLLFTGEFEGLFVVKFVCSTLLWCSMTYVLAHIILKAAKTNGKLGDLV